MMKPADPQRTSNHIAQRASAAPAEPELSIVIPVYRSADCLEALMNAISAALVGLDRGYEVIFVNDCSPDGSWAVIESLCHAHANVVGVDLRRNFGQDNAILTGLRLARGRYVAIMDDDLQHDPRHLPLLLSNMDDGVDVVYAAFHRKHQKLWKNLGSWANGKVAEWVLSKPKDIYLSPYKVIRSEVAKLVCNYRGAEPYIDGLILQVTSRITQVQTEHRLRFAGTSNYTFWKSVRLWGRVTFSFSVQPLRLVTLAGFIFSVLGLLLAMGVILYKVFFPEDFGPGALGWASLMVAILLIGGIQMVFFGILGEYAGRTYLRVNSQPQSAVRLVMRGEGSMECAQPWEMQNSDSSPAAFIGATLDEWAAGRIGINR